MGTYGRLPLAEDCTLSLRASSLLPSFKEPHSETNPSPIHSIQPTCWPAPPLIYLVQAPPAGHVQHLAPAADPQVRNITLQAALCKLQLYAVLVLIDGCVARVRRADLLQLLWAQLTLVVLVQARVNVLALAQQHAWGNDGGDGTSRKRQPVEGYPYWITAVRQDVPSGVHCQVTGFTRLR